MHFPIQSANNRSLQPIGVFDSGTGGLTVVRALQDLLPSENIFYIGDTARLPYGGKNKQTIERYSIEVSGLLLAENAKMIVVACNTASALAVPRLQELLKVPIVDVIAPGAHTAVKQTRNGCIGVIGTKATVYSQAYDRAIRALNPEVCVTSQACPLLVPLVEEAWLDEDITREVLHRYLDPLIAEGIDTLVLGCTHYPLLAPLIAEIVGPNVQLVDSAKNCAISVRQCLEESGLQALQESQGRLDVALTDSSNTFLSIARKALNLKIDTVKTRLTRGVALVETA